MKGTHGLGNTRPTTGAGDQYLEGVVTAIRESIGELHKQVVTVAGARILGAVARQINNNQSMRLGTMPGRIAGYALKETTGAAAAFVRLRDGADVGGDILVPISFLANESVRDWFLPSGISYGAGLYLEIVSGSVEGAIFLAPGPP